MLGRSAAASREWTSAQGRGQQTLASSMNFDFGDLARHLQFGELRVGLQAAIGGTALTISTEVSQVGLPEGLAVLVPAPSTWRSPTSWSVSSRPG